MPISNMATNKVEVGFTGNLSATVWTDISQYVKAGTITYGRARETDDYATGTGSLTLINTDGRFSPDNLSGPYVTGGVTTQVRPWIPIRITATFSATNYLIWFGLATVWADLFDTPNYAATQVSMVDPMALLAGHAGSGAANTTPVLVGGGETSGARISRLITDAIGSDLTRTLASTRCIATMQATPLTLNTLAEIQSSSLAEGGAFWWDPTQQAFQFEEYGALITNSRSNTSQVTFGDGGGAEIAYDLPVHPVTDGQILWNTATYQRSGGLPQTASDATSITANKSRSITQTGLQSEGDPLCSSLANLWVARWKNPENRIASLTLSPASNTAAWPHALGRRIRDRVIVKYRPKTSTAFTLSRNCFIDGISHTWTNATWQTKFALASATAWDGFTTSVWDTGTWGSATWFY